MRSGQFNLSEIPDGGDFLQPGIHSVFIYEINEGASKKGTHYFEVCFKDGHNRAHLEKFYNTVDALWRIKKLFIAAGYPPNTLNANIYDLRGKEISIEIVTETYTKADGNPGKINKIKSIEPIPEQQNSQQQQPPQKRKPPERTGKPEHNEDWPPDQHTWKQDQAPPQNQNQNSGQSQKRNQNDDPDYDPF